MQGRDRSYLGAVALNNAAVLLLERGQCRHALTVLQDAMFAMREVIMSTTPTGVDHQQKGQANPTQGPAASMARQAQESLGLDGMLQRASSYVLESAAAYDPQARPFMIESTVLDMDAPRLRMREGGDAPEAYVTLIRIDATHCHDAMVSNDENGNVPGVESIAILHNFAAATLLLPPSEQGLRRRAVGITAAAFGFAHGILRGDYASGRATTAGGPVATLTVLQMSAMVATCNFQLHVDLGHVAEALRSRDHLRVVQSALAEEMRSTDFWEWHSILHAKAA
jgi:hypothetical protein